MGEILVMTLAYIRLPIRTLGGGRGNSVKRGSYRHAAYVCFDERLLLANVLGWVSQFWGTQYSCSVKYFEVSVVHQKNFYKIHFWAFAFPILMLSIFGQNPRLRLATIFADELISKTHGALGNFFSDNWSQNCVSFVQVPSPSLQNECKCYQDIKYYFI